MSGCEKEDLEVVGGENCMILNSQASLGCVSAQSGGLRGVRMAGPKGLWSVSQSADGSKCPVL